ncbi:MAG: flagellin, partial [Agathobacter sp.]|nr:flagellin [Agathobacter sp.]
KNVADSILTNDYEMEVSYMKFGFDAEDARPEYYYNCTDYSDCVYTKNDVGSVVDGVTVTDEMVGKAINATLVDKKAIEFTYDSQPISYTVANNTELIVNTQAKDVFDTGIRRDINEMIDIVQKAISAHDKVDRITSMMKETQYVDDKHAQEVLQTYLDAAKKEADYADSNLQKTYGDYITRFDKHLAKVNSAITEVGNTQSRLSLIQTRVENQYTTIEELKSLNEDRDLSDVIIDYTAVYNAYQASLMATSKVGQTSLLDYL